MITIKVMAFGIKMKSRRERVRVKTRNAKVNWRWASFYVSLSLILPFLSLPWFNQVSFLLTVSGYWRPSECPQNRRSTSYLRHSFLSHSLSLSISFRNQAQSNFHTPLASSPESSVIPSSHSEPLINQSVNFRLSISSHIFLKLIPTSFHAVINNYSSCVQWLFKRN